MVLYTLRPAELQQGAISVCQGLFVATAATGKFRGLFLPGLLLEFMSSLGAELKLSAPRRLRAVARGHCTGVCVLSWRRADVVGAEAPPRSGEGSLCGGSHSSPRVRALS